MDNERVKIFRKMIKVKNPPQKNIVKKSSKKKVNRNIKGGVLGRQKIDGIYYDASRDKEIIKDKSSQYFNIIEKRGELPLIYSYVGWRKLNKSALSKLLDIVLKLNDIDEDIIEKIKKMTLSKLRNIFKNLKSRGSHVKIKNISDKKVEFKNVNPAIVKLDNLNKFNSYVQGLKSSFNIIQQIEQASSPPPVSTKKKNIKEVVKDYDFGVDLEEKFSKFEKFFGTLEKLVSDIDEEKLKANVELQKKLESGINLLRGKVIELKQISEDNIFFLNWLNDASKKEKIDVFGKETHNKFVRDKEYSKYAKSLKKDQTIIFEKLPKLYDRIFTFIKNHATITKRIRSDVTKTFLRDIKFDNKRLPKKFLAREKFESDFIRDVLLSQKEGKNFNKQKYLKNLDDDKIDSVFKKSTNDLGRILDKSDKKKLLENIGGLIEMKGGRVGLLQKFRGNPFSINRTIDGDKKVETLDVNKNLSDYDKNKNTNNELLNFLANKKTVLDDILKNHKKLDIDIDDPTSIKKKPPVKKKHDLSVDDGDDSDSDDPLVMKIGSGKKKKRKLTKYNLLVKKIWQILKRNDLSPPVSKVTKFAGIIKDSNLSEEKLLAVMSDYF